MLKYYYKWHNHSFQGLNKGILHFQGVPRGKTTTIAQKAVSLQLAKFHSILTPRPMISTSAFLPCVLISAARESSGRSWRSILHHTK